VAINDNGQILVYGHYDGDPDTPFLLSPRSVPEPGSIALLALGGIGIWIRMRARRRK